MRTTGNRIYSMQRFVKNRDRRIQIRRRHISLLVTLGLPVAFLCLLIARSTTLVYADTYTVTSTDASGSGSLQQAIIHANNSAGHDTITFDASVTGTIVLTAALPAINGDLTISGPGADQLAISGGNTYRVFSIAPGAAMTVSGVTVQDGYADAGGGIWSAGNLHLDAVHLLSNLAASHGGGLYVFQGSATLLGTHVVSNSAIYGGGVYVSSGSATLIGTQVLSNSASSRGGGVYVEQDSAMLSVNEGGIGSNSAGYGGGGLCVQRGTATLTRTRVFSNSAHSPGGGVFVSSGSATLIGTQVLSNSAQAGGGMFIEFGSARLTGTQVVGNWASARLWGGGGMFVERGSATLNGTQVLSNSAQAGGGGVRVSHGSVKLSGAQVIGNSALDGGGVFLGGPSLPAGNVDAALDNAVIADNQVAGEGSGLYVENNSTARLRHNTIARNTGGSGIHIALNSTVALTNTIVVSHTVGILATAGNTATLESTLWGIGAWANMIDTLGLVISNTNITGNPAFIDPDAGNYHIGSTSTAINAAVNAGITTDIDGQSRPAGSGYDIGADEFWRQIYLPVVSDLHQWP